MNLIQDAKRLATESESGRVRSIINDLLKMFRSKSNMALVKKVYPNAVCIRFRGMYRVFSDLYGRGKRLSQSKSSRKAWEDAAKML